MANQNLIEALDRLISLYEKIDAEDLLRKLENTSIGALGLAICSEYIRDCQLRHRNVYQADHYVDLQRLITTEICICQNFEKDLCAVNDGIYNYSIAA